MTVFTHALATDNYGPAKFIVSANAYEGTHTTIAAALASATSGSTIFSRPGTYTENLTLKAGVNLSAYTCDAFTPNVTIIGTLTATFAGTASISGIQLQTNGANFLVVSGASATNLFFELCFLNVTNNTGVSMTSSGGARVVFHCCRGNLATTGIAYFVTSGTNTIELNYCELFNGGGSQTANTFTNTDLIGEYSAIFSPIALAGSGVAALNYFEISTGGGVAQTCVTTGSSNGVTCYNCLLLSDSASALSISSGTTANIYNTIIGSGNTNAITGMGTLEYGGLTMEGSSSTINSTLTLSSPGMQLGSYRAQLQPAFNAQINSNVTNATGNGAAFQLGTTTAFTTIFDQAGNFNTNGTFTAPISGQYFFTYAIRVANIVAGTALQVQFNTSSLDYFDAIVNPLACKSSNGQFTVAQSHFTHMNAGDTAVVIITINGEAANTNTIIGGNGATYFGGYLVC
jgi:hypothetical protein